MALKIFTFVPFVDSRGKAADSERGVHVPNKYLIMTLGMTGKALCAPELN